jgi:hypothetical protein
MASKVQREIDPAAFAGGWAKLSTKLRIVIMRYILHYPSPITHDDCDEIFDAALQPLLVYQNKIPEIREAVYSAFYQEHSFQLNCFNLRLQSSREAAGKKLYYCWALYWPSHAVRMFIRKFITTLSFAEIDIRKVQRFLEVDIHPSAHITVQITQDHGYEPTSWAKALNSSSSTLETRLHQGWKNYSSFTRIAFGETRKLKIPCNGKTKYTGTLCSDLWPRVKNDTDTLAEFQRRVEEDLIARITSTPSNRVH